MAAGLGFKTFTTGEVLTAADTNGYLMQGVLVFASTAARDAAITSPQEGQFAFTKDTDQLWYRSASAWVASGATGDIEGVTAGTGISGGGTSGTVTVSIDTAVTVDKTTAQTLTNKTLTSPALTTPTISTLTTNGDLLYGTGSGALDRLGIGSTSQVLTVTGGVPVWATAGGGYSPDMFGVTKNGNQSFSAGTWTKITSWTELYDIGADFTTPTFTVPVTGYYSFSPIARTYSSTSSGSNRQVLALYNNGSVVRYLAATTNLTDCTLNGSTTLYLNVNDNVEVYIYNDNSSPTVDNTSTSWVGQFVRS